MKQAEFEKAFYKGHRSYDAAMGDWWLSKSQDAPHRRAYKNIVRFIDEFLRSRKKPSPKIIVDYGCGSGAILKALAKTFSNSSIVAIDGSRKMLKQARNNLAESNLKVEFVPAGRYHQRTKPQLSLVQTPLPNFSMPAGKVDVALFLFPNVNATPSQMAVLRKYVRDRGILGTARLLATLRKKIPDPIEVETTIQEFMDNLLLERIVCMNIHRLLKKGGLWFKVEYSGCSPKELTELEKWELLFTECAMKVSIDGKKQPQLFQHLDTQYFRSSVIMDVHDQSHDPDHKAGGYFISAFRAL